MIDSLLLANQQAIHTAGQGYGPDSCRIMADGYPPAACGNVFLAIHQGSTTSLMDNALDEYFAVTLTLTMRVSIPVDRVGDQLLAQRLAKNIGMNRRINWLATFLHMNWEVIGIANNLLIELFPEADVIHGFAEPLRYRNSELPSFVGGEWFASAPEAEDVGLKAEIRFEDARRLQAIEEYV